MEKGKFKGRFDYLRPKAGFKENRQPKPPEPFVNQIIAAHGENLQQVDNNSTLRQLKAIVDQASVLKK